MLTIGLALFLQLEPLDKALEAAKKDAQPVLVFFHRKDWEGAEKIGKNLRRVIGDSAAKFVLAHAGLEEHEALKLKDGAVLILDPFEGITRTPLARVEDDSATEEALKKAVAAGLEAWGERSGARAAVTAVWNALKKEDIEAFKAALWQCTLAGGGDVTPWFKEGVEGVAKWDRIEFKSVTEADITKVKAQDSTVKAVYRVQFDMMPKEGKKDGTSFKVARTEKGCFVIWER